MALAAIREQLDQLMGADRNGEADPSKQAPTDFADSKVCKHYLCGLCPHVLFSNTRADIGTCPRVHNDDLVRQYQEACSEGRRFGYNDELERFSQELVADIDRRIQRALKRLQVQYGLDDTDGLLVSDPDALKKAAAVAAGGRVTAPVIAAADDDDAGVQSGADEDADPSRADKAKRSSPARGAATSDAGSDDETSKAAGSSLPSSSTLSIKVLSVGMSDTASKAAKAPKDALTTRPEGAQTKAAAEEHGKHVDAETPLANVSTGKDAASSPVTTGLAAIAGTETEATGVALSANGANVDDRSELVSSPNGGVQTAEAPPANQRNNADDSSAEVVRDSAFVAAAAADSNVRWTERVLPDGRMFWRNMQTGVSSWEKPPEEEIFRPLPPPPLAEATKKELDDKAEEASDKAAAADDAADGEEKKGGDEETGGQFDRRQKLRVCEQCGAFLSIFDSEKRLADHFTGKMHVGYLTLRMKILEMRENRRRRVARVQQIDAPRSNSRRERDGRRASVERPREASRKRERSPERSRSRHRHDRSRRSRSRSRERRERKRRHSRSRSASRSRSRERDSYRRHHHRRSHRSRSRDRRR